MKTEAIVILAEAFRMTGLVTVFLKDRAEAAAAALPEAMAEFSDIDLEDPEQPRAALEEAMKRILAEKGIPACLVPVAARRWLQAADARAAAEARWRAEVKGERLSIPQAGNRRIKIMDEMESDLADRNEMDMHVLSRLEEAGILGGMAGDSPAALPEAAAAAFFIAGLPLDPALEDGEFLRDMDIQWVSEQPGLVGKLAARCGDGRGGVRNAWEALDDPKTLLWAAFALGSSREEIAAAYEAQKSVPATERCTVLRRMLPMLEDAVAQADRG